MREASNVKLCPAAYSSDVELGAGPCTSRSSAIGPRTTRTAPLDMIVVVQAGVLAWASSRSATPPGGGRGADAGSGARPRRVLLAVLPQLATARPARRRALPARPGSRSRSGDHRVAQPAVDCRQGCRSCDQPPFGASSRAGFCSRIEVGDARAERRPPRGGSGRCRSPGGRCRTPPVRRRRSRAVSSSASRPGWRCRRTCSGRSIPGRR